MGGLNSSPRFIQFATSWMKAFLEEEPTYESTPLQLRNPRVQ